MAVQGGMIQTVGEHVAAINQALDLEQVETFNAKKMTRYREAAGIRADDCPLLADYWLSRWFVRAKHRRSWGAVMEIRLSVRRCSFCSA